MKLAKVFKSARTTKTAIRHLVLAVENLEKLNVAFTRVTEEYVEAFWQTRPNLTIQLPKRACVAGQPA